MALVLGIIGFILAAIVPLQQWKESGLSLSHYFPSAGNFAVIARFFNEDGSPVTTAQGDAIAYAGRMASCT